MKKVNLKKITKDVLFALAYGFISLMVIVGATTLALTQVPYKVIFIGTIIIAIVSYGIYAAFNGFSLGYFLNLDDVKKSNVDEPYSGLVYNLIMLFTDSCLHIPLGLNENIRVQLIDNQAKMFSHTLLAASSEGKGEPYFQDLNATVTTNIAIVCMLWRNLRGEQTNIGEIYECINNFELMYPMLMDINAELGLNVAIADPAELRTEKEYSNTKAINKDREAIENRTNTTTQDCTQRYLKFPDPVDADINKYRTAIEYINDQIFLNEEKMYEQLRGLRDLLYHYHTV